VVSEFTFGELASLGSGVQRFEMFEMFEMFEEFEMFQCS
jgi:hypothetical protein